MPPWWKQLGEAIKTFSDWFLDKGEDDATDDDQ
jgi:hypothetical protein